MPWKVDDVDKHMKGLTDAQKRTWVEVANGALESCKREGGSDCEAAAVRRANAVVGRTMAVTDEHGGKTYTIRGVEIFAAGTHNGRTYTTADLVDIIDGTKRAGIEPPLKDGHHKDKGAPALGWVENLRLVGNKILADFVDLHEMVYTAIKERRYDKVSAEIYVNLPLPDGKTTVKYALRAVALLGAEIPVVKELKPLRRSIAEYEDTAVVVVEFSTDPGGVIKSEAGTSGKDGNMKKDKDMNEINDEINELKEALAEKERCIADLEAKLESGGDADVAGLRRELNDAMARLADQSKKLDEAEKRNHELIEERRLDRIKNKTEELKLPGIRPHVEVLYDLATKHQSVVSFAVNADDDPSDVEYEAVVDSLVETINRLAEKHLFSETSTVNPVVRDGEPADDNPRVEVDRYVRRYIDKQGLDHITDYDKGLDYVKRNHPELWKAYMDS